MKSGHSYIYYKHETFPSLPFDIRLSLGKIFHFWEEKAAHGSASEQVHARALLDSVAHLPELRTPFNDLDFIEEHHVEISSLLTAIFPEILTHNEIKAASLPFFPILFNMSGRLRSILENAGLEFQLYLKGLDEDEMYILACSFLIGSYYQYPINYKRPIYFDIPDKTTGMMRHYRVNINGDFTAMKPKPGVRPLTEEDIRLLVDNSHDVELWKKLIPPGSYAYEGLAILTLYDQSEDEALSELKQLLLATNALKDDDILEQVQFQLAQYLGTDKIEIGFEAFDADSCKVKVLYGATRSSKLLGAAAVSTVNECFCNNSMSVLLEKRETFSVSNVKDPQIATSVLVRHMAEAGVGSFIVAPLKYSEKVIAFIELTSPVQGTLNSMVANKLKNVLPMFTVAVSRTIDQHETLLEAIIQDKFTSLHPTVSWKFLQAAENILKNQNANLPAPLENISFQEVYPLYGQFDIRGSSDARNEAIRSDLMKQLDHADALVRQAGQLNKMPIFQHILFRIQEHREALGQSIHAGDEIRIIDFFHRELEPVFDFLKKDRETAKLVDEFNALLDPALGVVYEQRKNYEQSVTLINERICDYLDHHQAMAQKMFPHYFEKYKTDGVEYNAYVGQSLVPSGQFHPLHLRNMRLWQLLVTCGVENIHHAHMSELPMPLPVTSLILVHSNHLAIRFRMDEKRFDVDGAYNIRYEILKKRIDKAYIKDTTERLTQPGKLAIVYSQDWEAEEYLQYIRYLQSMGYLEDDLEKVELQDLQGTAGLQAFRVGFKYEIVPDELIREMMLELNAN